MELHTIGIDLGKTLFHLVGVDACGNVVVRKRCSEGFEAGFIDRCRDERAVTTMSNTSAGVTSASPVILNAALSPCWRNYWVAETREASLSSPE